jgi:hypothetical protein
MEAVCCELKYSRAGTALVVAAACATAAMVAALPVAAGWRLAALAWIAGHAWRAARALRAARLLLLGRDGAIRVGTRDGRTLRGLVRPGGFVAPWMVVVRWRPEGRRIDRTLLLLPGMVDARAMRNIRVILRWS